MNKKTKILLVNPPATVFKSDPTIPPSKTLPLNLMYIASYLEKNHYSVEILNCLLNHKVHYLAKQKKLYGLTDKQIIKQIKQIKPNIIGISCMYSAYAQDAHRIAKLAKRINKSIYIIMGGSHASIFPKLIIKDKNIDLVVFGEGEATFLDIVSRIKHKKSLNNILGTTVRYKNKIIQNKWRPLIQNLDNIPFPAYHLVKMSKYLSLSDQFLMRKPGVALITSRGCPGRCIYCSIHSVWQHQWRSRSPQNIIKEIIFLINKYKVKEFYFLDDNMGINKKRLQNICREIINHKLDIKWTVPNGIAHWTLDEKTLDLMKQSGCYRITFGIESGNPKNRRLIGKPFPLEQATKMIKYANKIGLWTLATFIIGFPWETKKQINDTINYAVNCDIDLAIFYLLCPYPGTKVYEMFKKANLLNYDYIFNRKRSFDKYFDLGKILAGKGTATSHFTVLELNQFIKQAYTNFFSHRILSFLNPLRSFRKIHSWEDFVYLNRIFFGSIPILTRLLIKHNFISQNLRRD